MSHFEGKAASEHIKEKRAEGINSDEAHGLETPGFISALSDAMRESGVFFLLVWALFPSFKMFFAFAFGLVAWKTGRSAWLAWSRLERLHRVVSQEKYEIENHRPQEREELIALYQEKGFQGKLLDDVVDHLMADSDRLLKVMLEEELGLKLEAYEHPLKQAFGAFVGSMCTIAGAFALYFISPQNGIFIASIVAVLTGAFLTAYYERNRMLSSLIWNLALAGAAFGITYFLR